MTKRPSPKHVLFLTSERGGRACRQEQERLWGSQADEPCRSLRSWRQCLL